MKRPARPRGPAKKTSKRPSRSRVPQRADPNDHTRYPVFSGFRVPTDLFGRIEARREAEGRAKGKFACRVFEFYLRHAPPLSSETP